MATSEADRVRLGVDPTGGTDPNAKTVSWLLGGVTYQEEVNWQQLRVRVTASANCMTVFLENSGVGQQLSHARFNDTELLPIQPHCCMIQPPKCLGASVSCYPERRITWQCTPDRLGNGREPPARNERAILDVSNSADRGWVI